MQEENVEEEFRILGYYRIAGSITNRVKCLRVIDIGIVKIVFGYFAEIGEE